MSLERFSLNGRRALVTGGSRGIGEAIAVGLAEAGADVALVARSTVALEGVAAAIRGVGQRAVVIAADVTDLADVEAACTRAIRELDGVDVLVNNAGGPLFHAPNLEVRDEGWQHVIDLNLTSAFRFSQRIGRWMVDHGRGAIINITAPANKAWPAIAAYAAAKAGLDSLTKTLAAELAPFGVRVNAVAPGWVKTAINQGYVDDEHLAPLAVSAVPLGRWAEPEEITGAVVWLASDAASYVTGTVVPVDGGFAAGMGREWLEAMDRSRRAGNGHNHVDPADRHTPQQPFA
jgi:NAD(P)-dependent dehydrogenase (short-subunit alcohol dehydrogenase family)